MYVSAIIAAGGLGLRFGGSRPKQLLWLRGRPILQRTVDAFLATSCIDEVVVAVPPDVAAHPPAYLTEHRERERIHVVAGGARRQDSVAQAFANISPRAEIVVVHDAARPLVNAALIERTVRAAAAEGAAIAGLRAGDTVKRTSGDRIVETLAREEIVLAQTPQAFRVEVLRAALDAGGEATDEALLAERAGHRVHVVAGDPRNIKITTPEDLAIAERLLGAPAAAADLRIGNGYDLHRLVPGGPLLLGGTSIPFDKQLAGHSDADAVCHALTDAILGGCGAGDIGRHFPDTDPAWKGADSLRLLERAAGIVRDRGFSVVNVDVVIVAERPKLVPHAPAMIANLARALGIDPSRVSVKGKTNEGVGAIGGGDAIAVHAVALLSTERSC